MLNCVALDRIFHALSDRWRRWIVECLSDGSGLIHTQKVGRVRTCRIEPQALHLLDDWITPRRRLWDRRLQ